MSRVPATPAARDLALQRELAWARDPRRAAVRAYIDMLLCPDCGHCRLDGAKWRCTCRPAPGTERRTA